MSRSGSPADAMTASTTEIPELAGVEPHGDWEPTPWLVAETHPLLRSRNFYIALTVISLALGGLSLLIPSTPSYDPWSWTDWARGIIHLNFHLNQFGTSWKPLPMIATIPAALFGHAAPDIWLVVARAGTLAGAVMVFRLGYRLTRQIAESYDELSASRVLTIAPALLAGLIGAVALVFTGTEFYLSSNTLGYSEGLATALMLVAIERHLDGKPRQAFIVGFFVALDRPEVWVFWGVYGLWLFWRDARFRVTIAALAVLQPILWFLPVYWGSGHFGSSVERATNPRANSLALRQVPVLGRAQAGGLADDVAADQAVRGAAGARPDGGAVARSPSRRQLARCAGGPANAGAGGGGRVRVRRRWPGL